MTKRSKTPRLLLIISFLAFISLGLPDGLLGVAWPSISAEFDRALSRLAVLQVALTCGFFFSSVNAGRLIVRFGVGRLLIGSNIVIAVALTGYSFAQEWYLLVASTVVLGSGGGVVDAGLNAYSAQRFSKEQVTLLHAFYGFGAMLGPMLMREVLARDASWRYGYMITLLLILLLLTVFIFTGNIWYSPQEKSRGHVHSRERLQGRLRRRAWMGVALFLVYTGVEVTVGAWSYTLLTAGRGIAASPAAIAVGIFWGALTGGRLFFGFFGDRWQAHGVVNAMFATAATGAVLLLQPWSGTAALASLPLLGFAFAPLFPFFVTLTPHVVGEEQSSRIIGFQVASANIGSALIPLLVGTSVELISLEAVAYMVVLLTVLLTIIYRMWMSTDHEQTA
jgi:fucose permease